MRMFHTRPFYPDAITEIGFILHPAPDKGLFRVGLTRTFSGEKNIEKRLHMVYITVITKLLGHICCMLGLQEVQTSEITVFKVPWPFRKHPGNFNSICFPGLAASGIGLSPHICTCHSSWIVRLQHHQPWAYWELEKKKLQSRYWLDSTVDSTCIANFPDHFSLDRLT